MASFSWWTRSGADTEAGESDGDTSDSRQTPGSWSESGQPSARDPLTRRVTGRRACRDADELITVVALPLPEESAERNGKVAAMNDAKPAQGLASAAEVPVTVREAARFLGVSPQTVYAWVERQISHLRVMGRNIRFLRSEFAAFRATFKLEVENGTTEKA